jgi:hypothetical protein
LESQWVQFAALLPTRQVHTRSATTLRRRRDEWITLGLGDRLRTAVLGTYRRLFGLELEHLAMDGCVTKAPCGGQTARPTPADRRTQGLKRSTVTEAKASRWAWSQLRQPS